MQFGYTNLMVISLSVTFPLGHLVKLEVLLGDIYIAPSSDICQFFPERRLIAHRSFLLFPHQVPLACCVCCNKWPLSVEIQGPDEFQVRVEVGGGKSLIQGVGGLHIQTAYSLCPVCVSNTGFRDFEVAALCAGLGKKDRKQLLQNQLIFRARKDWEILIWSITLILQIRNIRPKGRYGHPKAILLINDRAGDRALASYNFRPVLFLPPCFLFLKGIVFSLLQSLQLKTIMLPQQHFFHLCVSIFNPLSPYLL